MEGKTIFLFPTSAEAAGFRTRCPEAEWYEIGVGMAEAGARTAQAVAATGCRRAVLCGIAGACDGSLSAGDVVEVALDGVAGLPAAYAATYRMRRITDLPSVRSLTVSRTGEAIRSGEATGDAAADTLPLVEQMEGAAVAAVCRVLGVEAVHLRAISNRVGDPRSEWRVAEAVEALGRAAAQIVGEAHEGGIPEKI